jgi:hypothetical protein
MTSGTPMLETSDDYQTKLAQKRETIRSLTKLVHDLQELLIHLTDSDHSEAIKEEVCAPQAGF